MEHITGCLILGDLLLGLFLSGFFFSSLMGWWYSAQGSEGTFFKQAGKSLPSLYLFILSVAPTMEEYLLMAPIQKLKHLYTLPLNQDLLECLY